MRIVRGQMLGGVPIENVRRLLRRNGGNEFGVALVADELDISTSRAQRLVKALLRDGYVRRSKGRGDRAVYYERTLDGSTLAAATMAPPLRRATVGRLLEAVIERARAVNASDDYAYRVARIALFGSALNENPRPNYVDLAVTLAKRHADADEQERAERARQRVARDDGRRFQNMTDEVFWPQTEVLRVLRGRSRGLSLSEGDAPGRLGAEAKIIFEDVPKKTRSRTRRHSS